MKIQDAREVGERLACQVMDGKLQEASNLLSPLLAERTSFRLLDAIGAHLGDVPPPALNPFLDQVAADRSMGGWVIIASALRQKLPADLPGTFERCCWYVEVADVWYATDTFAERVPGPALVDHFQTAVTSLEPWQQNSSRWIRRMVGVAVHFWAKRTHGAAQYQPQVSILLSLLEPMFSEREQDAIKGVGWGLKTLGRYYPSIMADWLTRQVGRPHRALMLQKAVIYLPAELRRQVLSKKP